MSSDQSPVLFRQLRRSPSDSPPGSPVCLSPDRSGSVRTAQLLWAWTPLTRSLRHSDNYRAEPMASPLLSCLSLTRSFSVRSLHSAGFSPWSSLLIPHVFLVALIYSPIFNDHNLKIPKSLCGIPSPAPDLGSTVPGGHQHKAMAGAGHSAPISPPLFLNIQTLLTCDWTVSPSTFSLEAAQQPTCPAESPYLFQLSFLYSV